MYGGIYYGGAYMGGSGSGRTLTVTGLQFAADYAGFPYGGMYLDGTEGNVGIYIAGAATFTVTGASVGPVPIPTNPTMFLLVKLIQA